MSLRSETGRIIGRVPTTFFQQANIGGERRMHAFEKTVVLLLKSTTLLRMLHGGNVVKEGGEHNDFYGYLTSMSNLNPDAVAEKYSVDVNSSLEITLSTSVHICGYLENKEAAIWNTDAESRKMNFKLLDIPLDFLLKAQGQTQDDGLSLYRSFENILLAESVTWSSKNSAEENAQIQKQFRTHWLNLDARRSDVDAALHQTQNHTAHALASTLTSAGISQAPASAVT